MDSVHAICGCQNACGSRFRHAGTGSCDRCSVYKTRCQRKTAAEAEARHDVTFTSSQQQALGFWKKGSISRFPKTVLWRALPRPMEATSRPMGIRWEILLQMNPQKQFKGSCPDSTASAGAQACLIGPIETQGGRQI